MTKGADNVMETRIKWTNNSLKEVQSHLYQFAVEGL